MKENSINKADFPERILQGIRKAIRKLVEESAAKNQSLVIGDKDGNIKDVPAKELLEMLQEEEKTKIFGKKENEM